MHAPSAGHDRARQTRRSGRALDKTAGVSRRQKPRGRGRGQRLLGRVVVAGGDTEALFHAQRLPLEAGVLPDDACIAGSAVRINGAASVAGGIVAVLAWRVGGSTHALILAAGMYLAPAAMAPAADRTTT